MNLPTSNVPARKPNAMPVVFATLKTVTSALRQADHDRQDDEPNDIINDGGPEDDLTLRLFQPVEVGEDTSRNTDACSGEAGSSNDGDKVAKAEHPADEITQTERQSDTDGGNCRRSPTDLQQFLQVGFQSDLEKQNDNAEFGQQVQDIVPWINDACD